jgi:hypothetical protein
VIRVRVADPLAAGNRRGIDGDLDPAGVWFTLMLPGTQLFESPFRPQLVKNRAGLERSKTMTKRVLQFVDPKMVGTSAIGTIQKRASILVGHFARPFAGGHLATGTDYIGKWSELA